MMRLARVLEWDSTSQARGLLDALGVVRENGDRRREWLDAEVDLSFATPRWHKLVRRSHADGAPANRRYLELCVFSHMAEDCVTATVCVGCRCVWGLSRPHAAVA